MRNIDEQRSSRKRMELSRPDHAAGCLSQRPDIGGGLAGPGTERRMRFRPVMLMVSVGWRRMGEEATGRHQGQRHVHPGNTECDTGQGFVQGRSCRHVDLSCTCSSTLIRRACLPTDAHGCYTIVGSGPADIHRHGHTERPIMLHTGRQIGRTLSLRQDVVTSDTMACAGQRG